ncbi:MAG TPA: adenylate kinase [Acidimicrobiales bacterium]|nr:adenylate kinase [Acidimicrobiales bacterium]
MSEVRVSRESDTKGGDDAGTAVRLVLLGRPGAGKGTQSSRLARHFEIPHVSTGEILRAAVRDETEVGARARRYMEAGELLPDDVVVAIVADRLAADSDVIGGFLLDGFPRTVAQAEALLEVTAPRGVDLVIDLDVPTDVVLGRLAGRRVCERCGADFPQSAGGPTPSDRCPRCGAEVAARGDDTDVTIARRLDVYESQTAPVAAWFAERDLLVKVDGVGDPDEVTTRLLRTVERRRQERGTDR